MTRDGSRTAAASLPPAGLPGLEPGWSRLVELVDRDGIRRSFHVLDSWAGRTPGPDVSPQPEPLGTLLCVHGNPTWSYLWRRLFTEAPVGWRVLAVDQLGMGYSERIERPRVLSERVDDLGRLTDVLGITGPGRAGPVVTVAHDWGGIISLGWALAHRAQLSGVVLTNTAVHQPEHTPGPILIRLANVPSVTTMACRLTPLFVRATTSLARPRPPAGVRAAFAAPYRTVRRRRPVGDFVADIPFADDHPSHRAAREIAEGIRALDVPALLLWGPRDPVFRDVHLEDLRDRMPQADLHRYELAGHLLPEDAPDYAAAVTTWVGRLGQPVPAAEPAGPASAAGDGESVLARLEARAADHSAAVVQVGGRSITWAELNTRVRTIAAGLTTAGLRPGDRVALLVPPSIELTVALYAVWRAGGVIVVADKGLGLRGMGRALRGARLDWLIADTAGLLAARGMRLPGRRISIREHSSVVNRIARVARSFPALTAAGIGRPVAPDAGDEDEAAVLFTSGATGPAKGVLYRHRQVRAQLDLIRTTYGLTGEDAMVAAFAPFALYGPALGVPSSVPETDVTKPGQLTAAALGDAAAQVGATVVFASPAALRNVVATAFKLSSRQRSALGGIRLLMSAGASVPAELLQQVGRVLPGADLHTPYGMTEALPLTDISLTEIERAGAGDGVCVGRPLAGVRLAIAPLDAAGVPGDELTSAPMVSGEIWATAAHIRARYDASWVVDAAAADHPGWHRTGDVGQFDEQGRLWVQGRTVHIITTAGGPVTPIGIERRVQTGLDRLDPAGRGRAGVAAVGVGPAGIQQIVVVIPGPGATLAPAELTDAVRRSAGVDVAAVLMIDELPVDIRHNSKVDRVAVRRWASAMLAGG